MATRTVSEKFLNDAMVALEKSWGKGFNANGLADANYKGLPTGHDDLDTRLTRGASGLYKGGIVEIFGNEGGGKTSIAMRTAGFVQKAGGHVMWIDTESGFSEDLAKVNGLDPSKMKMPDLVETKKVMDTKKEAETENKGTFSLFNVNEILTMIYDAVALNVYDLIVLDSVAALMPERIITDDFDPNKNEMPTEVARAFSSLLKKIVPICKKTETTVIFINQVREKVGTYGSPEITPGGRALKFYASQRLKVNKKGDEDSLIYILKDDGVKELVGHYASVKIIKNKRNVPTPYVLEIPIYYIEYFPDDAKKAYDTARLLQAVTIRQNVLTWKDSDDNVILKIEGESSFLSKLREEKLEARLAAACVVAESWEKNLKKEKPVKVSDYLRKLAQTYDPNTSGGSVKAEAEPDKRKKKVKAAAIDLDE